jgi:outer membrane protein assembly factor BamE
MPAHPQATKHETKLPMSYFSSSYSSPNTLRAQLLSRSAMTVKTLLVVGLCALLGACSFPGVYRIDIPQGNIITQEMVDQLRPGLSKRQVTFILGTPLLRDTFDQDRWDYIYGYQPGGGVRSQERITIFFENDQLVRFAGDFTQTPENNQFPTTASTTSTKPSAAPNERL